MISLPLSGSSYLRHVQPSSSVAVPLWPLNNGPADPSKWWGVCRVGHVVMDSSHLEVHGCNASFHASLVPPPPFIHGYSINYHDSRWFCILAIFCDVVMLILFDNNCALKWFYSFSLILYEINQFNAKLFVKSRICPCISTYWACFIINYKTWKIVISIWYRT